MPILSLYTGRGFDRFETVVIRPATIPRPVASWEPAGPARKPGPRPSGAPKRFAHVR
jgi:hypothetical protein